MIIGKVNLMDSKQIFDTQGLVSRQVSSLDIPQTNVRPEKKG